MDAQLVPEILSPDHGDAENHQEKSASSANLTNTWHLTVNATKRTFIVSDIKVEFALNAATHSSLIKIVNANLSNPAASMKTNNVFLVKPLSPILREDALLKVAENIIKKVVKNVMRD